MADSILILGHTGFIGCRIYKELTSSGLNIPVIGVSSREVDLCDASSIDALASICNSATRLVVCSGIKRQFGDTVEIFYQNLRMIENLSRFVACNKISQLIYLSSSAVYGESNHNLNIAESTLVDPQTYYGLGKFSSESMFKIAMQKKNASIPFAILRLPLIYGPGDTSEGYGPADFVSRIMTGMPVTLWGDGKELREFVFVDDVARLVNEVIRTNFHGLINVATGISHTYSEVIGTLSELIKKPINIKCRERTRTCVDHKFNTKNLVASFQQFKFSSLEEGLVTMLEVHS